MQKGRHLFIFCRNAAEFSGPDVIWGSLKDSGNVFSGQTSPHFNLFLGKTDIGFYMPKMKKNIQTVTNEKCQNGGASVPTAWVICIYVNVPLMQSLMLEFWKDICCCQDFSQELHVHFSRTMPGLILHELQQCGFIGIVLVLDWPACSPDLSVWQITKRRIRQRRPRTVEQPCWGSSLKVFVFVFFKYEIFYRSLLRKTWSRTPVATKTTTSY